jgi:hypothetical protein
VDKARKDKGKAAIKDNMYSRASQEHSLSDLAEASRCWPLSLVFPANGVFGA